MNNNNGRDGNYNSLDGNNNNNGLDEDDMSATRAGQVKPFVRPPHVLGSFRAINREILREHNRGARALHIGVRSGGFFINKTGKKGCVAQGGQGGQGSQGVQGKKWQLCLVRSRQSVNEGAREATNEVHGHGHRHGHGHALGHEHEENEGEGHGHRGGTGAHAGAHAGICADGQGGGEQDNVDEDVDVVVLSDGEEEEEEHGELQSGGSTCTTEPVQSCTEPDDADDVDEDWNNEHEGEHDGEHDEHDAYDGGSLAKSQRADEENERDKERDKEREETQDCTRRNCTNASCPTCTHLRKRSRI